MRIERLQLINFRNYAYQELRLHPLLNLILGENAQGKTNLLESVYVAARGSSFKNVSDRQLIRFGERSAYVRADIESENRKKAVEVKFSMVEKKRVRINEVELENLKELTNQFECVLFAPEDLELVKGGPGQRRDYLDDLLGGIARSYPSLEKQYQKILFQRNQLLKGRKDSWFSIQMEAYDQQLAHAALPLLRYRKGICGELARFARDFHQRLTEKQEQLQIHYRSNAMEGDRLPKEEELLQRLQASRSRDLQFGNTDIGPHKDDIEIVINGVDARRFASQGQCRTVTLSLKLAELKALEAHNERKPILLLDDVFSELDQNRCQTLLETVKGYQTIITANQLDDTIQAEQFMGRFLVKQGKIRTLER